MKRLNIILLLTAMLAGCNTILEYPENGGFDPTLVTVDLSLDIDTEMLPYVPSKSADGDLHDVRWIIEVYRDEPKGMPEVRKVLSCGQAADGRHSIGTSLPLHAARYHIVAWMDYVDEGSVEDKYYIVNSLSSISIPEPGQYTGNEEHKDAFSARREIDLSSYRDRWNETVKQQITLTRPMARFELVTTDMDKFIDGTASSRKAATPDNQNGSVTDLSEIQVEVRYAGYFPSGFNACTDKPNDARTDISFSCCMRPLSAKEALLAGDHIFVNGSESSVTVSLQIRDGQGRLLNETGGISVPIVRGRLTTVRDDFLTKDYSPGSGIDPDFDGDINIEIPD